MRYVCSVEGDNRTFALYSDNIGYWSKERYSKEQPQFEANRKDEGAEKENQSQTFFI